MAEGHLDVWYQVVPCNNVLSKLLQKLWVGHPGPQRFFCYVLVGKEYEAASLLNEFIQFRVKLSIRSQAIDHGTEI